MSFLAFSILVVSVLSLIDSSTCEFGSSRIEGGEDADIKAYPYQVALINKKSVLLCGGSIIGLRQVLTAAHCVEGLKAEDIVVRAGTSSASEAVQDVSVQAIFVHPYYVNDSEKSGLGILVVKEWFHVGPGVARVDMPPKNSALEVGTVGNITGFGWISKTGEVPYHMQAVEVPVVSREDCKKIYPNRTIDDSVFCAGVKGRGFCKYDTGGPFVVNQIQYGVMYLAGDCGESGGVGLYINVSHFIQDTLFKKARLYV